MTKSNLGLDKTLRKLRQVSIDTNKKWSSILGIQQSTATTCVKPSGTVSKRHFDKSIEPIKFQFNTDRKYDA